MDNTIKCPWCGGMEFVVGYQHSEAMITIRPLGIFGSNITHTICRNCGTVIRSQIKEPWRFRPLQKYVNFQ